MNDTQELQQLEALRDFFIARNEVQLAAAYAALNMAVSFDLPSVNDWEALEFSFNRLFIGPMAPFAPFFASVYLEPEPQVMGKSTLITRQIFEMLGLQSPWQESLPDDHLSLELDACIRLLTIRQAHSSPEVEDLWNYFLQEHLAQWLPSWFKRVRAAENLPAAILITIDVLAAWLAEKIDSLKSTDRRLAHNE